MQEAVPQNQYGKKSGADARAWSEGEGCGRAGGRTGLFLKTCSQKDHILALMNQNHVAGNGGQDSRGPAECHTQPLQQEVHTPVLATHAR